MLVDTQSLLLVRSLLFLTSEKARDFIHVLIGHGYFDSRFLERCYRKNMKKKFMAFIQIYGVDPESCPNDAPVMQGMKINSAAVEKHNTVPVLTVVFQEADEMSQCCE